MMAYQLLSDLHLRHDFPNEALVNYNPIDQHYQTLKYLPLPQDHQCTYLI